MLRHDLRKKGTPKTTLNQMLNTSDTQSPTNNSSSNHITTGSNAQRHTAAGLISQGLSFQQQKNYYGKANISRQSLQVQGHQGDRLHEDQAL